MLTPDTIESAFGVKSAVFRDPATGALAISLIGPADEHLQNGTGQNPNIVAERASYPGGQGTKFPPER